MQKQKRYVSEVDVRWVIVWCYGGDIDEAENVFKFIRAFKNPISI
jgi:hypothetical protein